MVVAFASLFLGLTLGVQPVTVEVADSVASVELQLDGRSVATADPPEWSARVDFGSILSPHELTAVARDDDGEELGRAAQKINLPRAAAEASLVIEPGDDGAGAVARVRWESVAGTEPESVTATFDGRALQVSDPHRIPLPAHNPDQLHLLQVELAFSETVSTVLEATFGGSYGNEARTDLSSLAVVPAGDGEVPSDPAAFDGWLATIDAEPLNVVAVEEGPAEAVFVMDRGAQWEIWQLGRRMASPSATLQGPVEWATNPGAGARRYGEAVGRPDVSSLRYTLQLGKGQIFRLLWPLAQAAGGDRREQHAMELFPRAEEHPVSDGGVLWLLSEARMPDLGEREQRLVDAAAVAGMSATLRSRRRAVVLVLSERPADSSRLRPGIVQHYLSQIGVPLFIWVLGDVSEAMEEVWGRVPVRSVDARHRFGEAVRELSETLKRQRILWVEGDHLPQQIVVTGQARVRRVR